MPTLGWLTWGQLTINRLLTSWIEKFPKHQMNYMIDIRQKKESFIPNSHPCLTSTTFLKRQNPKLQLKVIPKKPVTLPVTTTALAVRTGLAGRPVASPEPKAAESPNR